MILVLIVIYSLSVLVAGKRGRRSGSIGRVGSWSRAPPIWYIGPASPGGRLASLRDYGYYDWQHDAVRSKILAENPQFKKNATDSCPNGYQMGIVPPVNASFPNCVSKSHFETHHRNFTRIDSAKTSQGTIQPREPKTECSPLTPAVLKNTNAKRCPDGLLVDGKRALPGSSTSLADVQADPKFDQPPAASVENLTIT